MRQRVNTTGIYDATFSVGATNVNDAIASFSARGPVTSDGSMRIKPDVAAPGVGVRSSVLNGQYGIKSGTSMAAPLVAGLAALLISADPDLAGDVDRIEEIITQSALPLYSTQNCPDFPGSQSPNAVFGHGRVQALKAVGLALGIAFLNCSDWPGLLENWTADKAPSLDANGNGWIEVGDMIPLVPCP